MTVTNKAALVDNDFICHVSESRLSADDLCDALRKILDELDKYAIVHTLVKKRELDVSRMATSQTVIDSLFFRNIITEALFSDIFDGDTGKQCYYEFLIQDFFSIVNPNDIMSLNEGESMLTYWRSGKSLGEIHSLATCMICDCGIFLSDDNDSKKIAEYINNKYMENINVLNREELVNTEKIKALLNRSTRKSLSHLSN